MLKTLLIALLPLLLFFGDGSDSSIFKTKNPARPMGTGVLEKMIPAGGSVVLDLDMGKLGGKARSAQVGFAIEKDSLFTVLVYNGDFRGPTPSTMSLVPQAAASLPGKLGDSYGQLMIENLPWGEQYEYAVRDAKTGYTFFNLDGAEF